jgi:hypothetical protein
VTQDAHEDVILVGRYIQQTYTSHANLTTRYAQYLLASEYPHAQYELEDHITIFLTRLSRAHRLTNAAHTTSSTLHTLERGWLTQITLKGSVKNGFPCPHHHRPQATPRTVSQRKTLTASRRCPEVAFPACDNRRLPSAKFRSDPAQRVSRCINTGAHSMSAASATPTFLPPRPPTRHR